MTQLRERICQKVAQLPLECNIDHVRTELEPLLQEAVTAQQQEEESSVPSPQDISPLMVASDKGNVSCLEYLTQQSKSGHADVSLFTGRPLDRTSDTLGGNSAMHHAATSGCVPALKLWHEFGKDHYSYQKLGSVTNAHGDTPLQIAAMAGHLEFVRSWYELALAEEEEAAEKDSSKRIQRIFETKNESGDTCISLACCHGHLDIVQFLLHQVKPAISHAELTKCQQACQRVIDSVARCNVQDPATLQSIQYRKEQMCQGLELFQQAYAQQVEQAAQDLMSQEVETTTFTKQHASRQENASGSSTNKNRKNKKGKKKTTKGSTSATSTKDDKSSDDDKPATPPEKDDTVRLTTLSDGKLAIAVPGEAPVEEHGSTVITRTPQPKAMSVSDMFRQRLHGAAPAPAPDSEIDAMMDALCLDVSMLLYTPHGMALNLSPSQLEAVEHILLKQISAVQEAREIQNRKHHQQQQSSSSSNSV